MKKIILVLSIVAVAVSCKKIPAGGNKGVLKLEEGVERYTDDVQGAGHEEHSTHEHHAEDSVKVSGDSTAVHQHAH